MTVKNPSMYHDDPRIDAIITNLKLLRQDTQCQLDTDKNELWLLDTRKTELEGTISFRKRSIEALDEAIKELMEDPDENTE
jgi:hypothetical protein